MFRVAVLATAIAAGLSLAVAAGAADARQVCNGTTLIGGEACLYSGPSLTGREFDISVPLAAQLPVPTTGDCVDLPDGFSTAGSVTNDSADTLYVFPLNCPDTGPGLPPVVVVPPHRTQNLRPDQPWVEIPIHSVRMCAPGLSLDPDTQDCGYLV